MYKNVIRQGDVNLAQVANIPSNAKPINLKKGDRIVLAYGEVTGEIINHPLKVREIHDYK